MLKKRILALVLAVMLCLSLATVAFAARDFADAENKAQALKYLGLMKGVSDTDFALTRAPTRLEALVMFLRLIGAEDAALSRNDKHPFADVPAWGSPYVGYAYQKGYTNGVSATSFDPNSLAGANTFLTYTLRALGYSDWAGGDFSFDRPYDLARNLGLLYDGVDTKNFLRADAALIAWESLFAEMKGGNMVLGDALLFAGLFSGREFTLAWEIANGYHHDIVFGVRMGSYTCYVDSEDYEYDPQYCPSLTLRADQSFSLTRNYGEGMETGTGYWTVEMDDEGYEYVILTVTSKYWGDGIREYYFWIDDEANLMLDFDDYLGITSPYSYFYFDY